MSIALPFSLMVFVFFTGLIILELKKMNEVSLTNPRLAFLPIRELGATNFKNIALSPSLQGERGVTNIGPSPAFGPMNIGRKISWRGPIS